MNRAERRSAAREMLKAKGRPGVREARRELAEALKGQHPLLSRLKAEHG
jgi:hypothetical protein